MPSRVVSCGVVWTRPCAARARVAVRVPVVWPRHAPVSARRASVALRRCRRRRRRQVQNVQIRSAWQMCRRRAAARPRVNGRRRNAPDCGPHPQISLAPPRSQLNNYRYRHLSADVGRCSCRVFETQPTPLESARDGHATTRAFAHSWRRMPLKKFNT